MNTPHHRTKELLVHGVLITFDTSASIDELTAPFTDYATALQSQAGLVSKAWISTDSGFGGFHVFADREAADGYLNSALAAGLMATDGFDNFQVRHFGVLDGLSAITGVNAVAV